MFGCLLLFSPEVNKGISLKEPFRLISLNGSFAYLSLTTAKEQP